MAVETALFSTPNHATFLLLFATVPFLALGCQRNDTTSNEKSNPASTKTGAEAAPPDVRDVSDAGKPAVLEGPWSRAVAEAQWLQAAKPSLQQMRHVKGLPTELAQFDTVFWDAADSTSLRGALKSQPPARSMLEIGTGTGLVSLWAVKHGYQNVVATDINPNALANAAYNAMQLDVAPESLQLRWVQADSPGAFSVIGDAERFDLIVSNPPWENQEPQSLLDHAFYDPGFALLESLMVDLANHLEPDGRCLLAYGCVTGIHAVLDRAKHHGHQAKILDDRKLDELPELFTPGMLIEVRLSQVTHEDKRTTNDERRTTNDE